MKLLHVILTYYLLFLTLWIKSVAQNNCNKKSTVNQLLKLIYVGLVDFQVFQLIKFTRLI